MHEKEGKKLEMISFLQYKIKQETSTITKLNQRKYLLEDSIKSLQQNICNIDLQAIHNAYKEVNNNVTNLDKIQKKFDSLVFCHNDMIYKKINFLSQELPELNEQIAQANNALALLLEQQKDLLPSEQ